MATQELNSYSHLTAKERDGMSYPAKILLERGLLKGTVLDFGCGFGADSFYLNKRGIPTTAYDPHYFPEYPKEKFDTIICLYVLNVLLENEQEQVHREVSSLLKPGGKAYFAVRRDIKNDGFRMHKLHQKKTFQCLVNLPYPSILSNEFCEIYILEKGKTMNNAHPSCPFCNLASQADVLCETPTTISILDAFPVNQGHALIIPKVHQPDYFDLPEKLQSNLWGMVNHVKRLLQDRYGPSGFNVGINCGSAAGQTVPHVHVHLIPRYSGDLEDPRGGVRGVIPHKRIYHP